MRRQRHPQTGCDWQAQRRDDMRTTSKIIGAMTIHQRLCRVLKIARRRDDTSGRHGANAVRLNAIFKGLRETAPMAHRLQPKKQSGTFKFLPILPIIRKEEGSECPVAARESDIRSQRTSGRSVSARTVIRRRIASRFCVARSSLLKLRSWFDGSFFDLHETVFDETQ